MATGGLTNRKGSAAAQQAELQNEMTKSVPFHFHIDKYKYGTVIGIVNQEGSPDNTSRKVGLSERIGYNLKIALSDGKECIIRNSVNYGPVITCLGTPGNLLGKPVRIKYKGEKLEDIAAGDVTFIDIPAEKQDEAKYAQPYGIGFIHGNAEGMEARYLMHTERRAPGDVT